MKKITFINHQFQVKRTQSITFLSSNFLKNIEEKAFLANYYTKYKAEFFQVVVFWLNFLFRVVLLFLHKCYCLLNLINFIKASISFIMVFKESYLWNQAYWKIN